ncbi:MAG: hypothetical protein IPM91_16490 [Bacteroidetes bacterium]|nr:hypothetical protein [Bacteroidota bacterium]
MGNGIIKSSSSVYYNYPDSWIFPVTLTVSYSNGCHQLQTAGPDLVIQDLPFVFWMSNGMGCAPLNVQFMISTTGDYLALGFW